MDWIVVCIRELGKIGLVEDKTPRLYNSDQKRVICENHYSVRILQDLSGRTSKVLLAKNDEVHPALCQHLRNVSARQG